MAAGYSRTRRAVRRARKLVIKATTLAGSGHPGGSLSMAEIVGTLLSGHMRHDPSNPLWPGRDRLVLSKGHAAPGLYSSLAVAGYFEESELATLRMLGSRLQGHPDLKCPGVEFCGGSLGIGLSFSVGLALASRMDSSGFRVYTVMGDGETDEGQVWEAAMSASKYGLDNLTVIMDRNFVQQDSYTEEVMPLDGGPAGARVAESRADPSRWRTGQRWRAFGWNVIEIDGHRIEQVSDALARAGSTRGAPTAIVARTVKGNGVEHMADNPAWHGRAPSPAIAPLVAEELDSQVMIAPSIIAGDMSDLAGEVARCEAAGADYVHLDVMDGRFVPATTFGAQKVAELRPLTLLPFDVHLMIAEPARNFGPYVEAGADIVTVHAEACGEAEFGEVHDSLRGAGVGVGLAINPGTDLPGWAGRFAPTLDQVIVMSVVPGKSGQAYIETTHEKARSVRDALVRAGFGGDIEADGGVNASNAGACFEDGARVLVGGGAIMARADARAAVAEMAAAVRRARRASIIERARGLGGDELVSSWIALHADAGVRAELEAIASGGESA